jgi:hypothetical protein
MRSGAKTLRFGHARGLVTRVKLLGGTELTEPFPGLGLIRPELTAVALV